MLETAVMLLSYVILFTLFFVSNRAYKRFVMSVKYDYSPPYCEECGHIYMGEDGEPCPVCQIIHDRK